MIIFYFDNKKRTSLFFFFWGYLTIPFIEFIYIAAATGTISKANSTDKCFLASKIWLMIDCIIFVLTIPGLLIIMRKLYLSKLEDKVLNQVRNGIVDTKNAVNNQKLQN